MTTAPPLTTTHVTATLAVLSLCFPMLQTEDTNRIEFLPFKSSQPQTPRECVKLPAGINCAWEEESPAVEGSEVSGHIPTAVKEERGRATGASAR